ncbi:MAG: excinuclease ABC subunit C [Microbacteriaceae bacterium]|nr:excinuclease ABC subunit C [Microbacteriaceae bacterium]
MSLVTAGEVQIPSSNTSPIIVEFTAHALTVGYVFERDVQRLSEQEWQVPGIYTLLSEGTTPEIYIGKSIKLRGRLLEHKRNPKIKWTRAMIVKRGTINGFNSAQIGYLEGRLAAELRNTSNITVSEGRADIDETLPKSFLISLDELVPTLVRALRLAGVDTFEKDEGANFEVDDKTTNGKPNRRVTLNDLLSSGLIRPGDKLHLSQGAVTSTGTVTATGEITVGDRSYSTPSSAAAAALGLQSSNGWVTWRVGSLDGKLLDQLRSEWIDTEVEE